MAKRSISGELKSAQRPKKGKMPGSYDELFKTVCGLAEELQQLNQQAVLEYTPVVESIIRSGCRDADHIERTLDSLLGFCGFDPALQLFRRLCRYYFDFAPAATVDYINIFRDQWDPEGKMRFQKTAPKTLRKRKPAGKALTTK